MHAVPDTPTAPDELDLRDYLRVLRRRKAIITLAVIVVVGGALTASFLQTPVYEGETEVLIQPRRSENLFDPNTGQARNPERNVQTEIEVVESQPVHRAVEDELGTEVPEVDASVIRDTDVVSLAVEHTDPEQAALIANTYANAYIDFRRTQNVDDLLAAAEEIQAKITELQTQIDAIDAAAQPDDGGETGEPAADGELSDAERAERDQLISQQALFRRQLDEIQVGAALKTGGAQVVTPAEPPDEPVRPTPIRSGALAGVVGLVFGVGLAFLFDYFDDSVRDRNDVDRATGGAPTLGMIPVVRDWKHPEQPRIVALSDPEANTAESYRALRTSVQFLGLERQMRTLQITSSTAGEGKTTTVANLAVLFARAGQRVVAVDCDLRRPRLHTFFDLSSDTGLTSTLVGEHPLDEALQDVEHVPRLSVLPCGPVPPLPSELIASQRTGEIIRHLEDRFDLVILDSPPAVPVTDASVLARWVDGVLLVATAEMTSRRDLQRAAEILQQVDAPLLGTVLNQVSPETGYGDTYGYGYRYGYSSRSRKRSTPSAPPMELSDDLFVGNGTQRRDEPEDPIPPTPPASDRPAPRSADSLLPPLDDPRPRPSHPREPGDTHDREHDHELDHELGPEDDPRPGERTSPTHPRRGPDDPPEGWSDLLPRH